MPEASNNLRPDGQRRLLLRLGVATPVAAGVTILSAVLATILHAAGDVRGGQAVWVLAGLSAGVLTLLSLILLLIMVRIVAELPSGELPGIDIEQKSPNQSGATESRGVTSSSSATSTLT